MPDFHFHHPIEIRYGDLDPQGHVNNARYLTYLEQARIAYVAHLGLWNGKSFLDIGFILADIQLTFKAPILYGQKIQVGVHVSRLGNKSMTMEYCIEDCQTGQELASGTSVLVTYDYQAERTMPIPETWRETLARFESLPVSSS